MASSFVPEAIILEGTPIATSFINTTGSDMNVGTIQNFQFLIGIVAGPSSSDSLQSVVSAGGVGSIIYTPGIRVLYSKGTTALNNGDQLFWDNTTKCLTSNSTTTTTFKKAGICAASASAAATTCEFFLNQTVSLSASGL